MKKYQIYGIGAALVDTEVVVSDEFLKQNQIEKGVMTLVDEPRQAELLNAFSADKHHLMKKSGGSACNTVIAAANFGARDLLSAGRLRLMMTVSTLWAILLAPGWPSMQHHQRRASLGSVW